ncbi:hypothetical protein ACQY0O_002616 [Thecaphora frezii]
MEEPLERGARKKPPFTAFWERPQKGNDAPSPEDEPARPVAASQSATLPRSHGGSTFVGVQRLIQQYSASSNASISAPGTSDPPKPVRWGRISGASGRSTEQPTDATAILSPARARDGSSGDGKGPSSVGVTAIATTAEAEAEAPAPEAEADPSAGHLDKTGGAGGADGADGAAAVLDSVPTSPVEQEEAPESTSTPAFDLPAPSVAESLATPAGDDVETSSNAAGLGPGPGSISGSATGSDLLVTPSSSKMLPSLSIDSTPSLVSHGSFRNGDSVPVAPRRSLSYDLGADTNKAVASRPRSATRSYLAAEDDSRDDRRPLTRADFADDVAYQSYKDAEKIRRMKKTLREQIKRRNKRRSGSVQGVEGGATSHGYTSATTSEDVTQAKNHPASLSVHSASSSISSQQRASQRPPRSGHRHDIWIDSGSSSSSRDFDHEAAVSRVGSPRDGTAEAAYEAGHSSSSSPVKISPEASFLPRSGSRRREKQLSISLADESSALKDTWLDLASPTLHEPTSTSTLRQDAIRQDRTAITVPQMTPSSLSLANPLIISPRLARSYSNTASASSQATSSPVSPSSLAFAPTLMSPTTSQMFVPTGTGGSSLRSHRTGAALPPPRPTPNAPLPPPPPGAPPPTRTSNRLRGYSAAIASASADCGIVDDHLNRNRSQSLIQNATPAKTASAMSVPRDSLASAPPATLAPEGYSIRQQSDRISAPTTTSAASMAAPAPHLGQMGRSMSTMAAGRSSEASPTHQASTLGPSGTIRGRPRGFTVGAVPASSGYGSYSASGRMLVPNKARPRSLLCNEIVPGLDLAERRAPATSLSEPIASSLKASSSSPASLVEPGAPHRSDIAEPPAKPSLARLEDRTPSRGAGDRSEAAVRSPSGQSGVAGSAVGAGQVEDVGERRPSIGGRSRSGSSASLLQQVNSQPKSHASFVIAVVGHSQSGKSTVIKKGLRQFGLSKPHILSEKVTSHSTACVVDQEQRTIEVLEIDASVLLNGPGKRFAWPKFLPHIDAVILCYDAAQISSFRGMSELLENFALSNLSSVMLACKSEVHPKAVDPYYASDMASVYNVGLAECTVESEEGKKRMRDCFSYLVKEVAKARTGRARRATASSVSSQAQTRYQQQLQHLQQPSLQLPQLPMSMSTLTAKPAAMQHRVSHDGGSLESEPDSSREQDDASSYPDRASFSSSRARGDSGASSYVDPLSGVGSIDASMDRSSLDASSPSMQNYSSVNLHEWRNTPRKMSNATVASNLSDAPSYTGSHEDDLALQESLAKARIGLQNARSTRGYVTIEELWDKLFHATVSGNDERFRDMFMVFYRGFARPIDLLHQMIARFEVLAAGESSEIMNRFALIRLTNMLGEWVQSYPGDLSHPETYALLVNFYARLQRHPSTTHTASLIRTAIEAAAYAPDVDAVWSKAVESASVQAVPTEGTNEEATTSSSGAGGEGDFLKPLKPASLKSAHSGGSAPLVRQSSASYSADVAELPSRNLSETSLGRGGSETSLLPAPPDPFSNGRNRSASDVTTSSNEGGNGAGGGLRAFAAAVNPNSSLSVTGSSGASTATGGSSAAASNIGPPAPTSPSVSTMSAEAALRPLDQKAALRAISNTLMEIDDEVIAAELTRLEWQYFTAIRPRDLLRHILVPREFRDGPVARSIAHFNYISAWVCSMILAQGKTKHRARMLEKFYNIASILRHDNNYGSLNSVLGGLSKTAVHRLKHTRELLKGRPINKTYQSLVRLMSSERSNAAYRLALENSEGPTVPYVGVHLQDILSISDGNPSKRSDGMIHWRKFSLMDEAVMAIVRCQQYERIVKPNPGVEKLIVDVPVMDDEALYERSLVVEPRSQNGQTTASSKIKDLKSFLSNAAGNAAAGAG